MEGRDDQGEARAGEDQVGDAESRRTPRTTSRTSAGARTWSARARSGGFKLLHVAGAYWRGSEAHKMLAAHLRHRLAPEEELEPTSAASRRRSGATTAASARELDLFSIQRGRRRPRPLASPRGPASGRSSRTTGGTSTSTGGYDIVYTPHIGRSTLWETSGHLEFYTTNMYSPIDIEGEQYYLKPMNCPFHITIYKSQLRSYRELPAPLRRARHGLPLRALGRAARAAARARLHPGRRAPLLPAGPGARRRSTASWTSACRSSPPSASRSTEIELTSVTRERRRRRRAATRSGSGRGGAAPRLLEARGLPYEAHRGRGRLLRPEDRHQDQGRPRAARGSARPSSSTSTCPSAST